MFRESRVQAFGFGFLGFLKRIRAPGTRATKGSSSSSSMLKSLFSSTPIGDGLGKLRVLVKEYNSLSYNRKQGRWPVRGFGFFFRDLRI